MHRLRWLSLLGVLGLLGFWINPFFYALFGFFVFLDLFWYDERRAAIFRAAATVTVVVTLFAFLALFLYLGGVAGIGGRNLVGMDPDRLLVIFGLGLGAVFGLFCLTWGLSTIYFERKGV